MQLGWVDFLAFLKSHLSLALVVAFLLKLLSSSLKYVLNEQKRKYYSQNL
jgi:hypothetical protein